MPRPHVTRLGRGLLALVAVGAGWGHGGVAGAPTAPLRTPSDPAAMWQAFVRAYWRPDAGAFCTFSDCRIQEIRTTGPDGGRYSDFWWGAQLASLTVDAAGALRTAGPDIRRVLDGFDAAYDPATNDYNDDLGWLAQASVRAYGVTGDVRDLQRAEALADRIWADWDDTYGGGVWWRRSVRDQKNVATNAPLVSTSLALYRAGRGAEHLARARQTWAWLRARVINGPRVYDHISGDGAGTVTRWDFTYNFGTVIDAAVSMAEIGGDPSALDVAHAAAGWALSNLTQNGVLLDEGGGDGGGFKGVFVRALRRLADAPGGERARGRYRAALARQGQAAWNARRSDGLTGSAWNRGAPDAPIESLSAASAVAAVLAAGPQPAGAPWADGRYEAENAVRLGVESGNLAVGHSGRGYVNGFHMLGQGVEFAVDAPRAGAYILTLRYAAGGGWASRRVVVNGAARGVNLPATPDWATWRDARVPVALPAGFSIVQVLFGPQDAGWINLDALTLTPEVP